MDVTQNYQLGKKLALFRVRQDENTSRQAGIRSDLRAQLYTAVVAILQIKFCVCLNGMCYRFTCTEKHLTKGNSFHFTAVC